MNNPKAVAAVTIISAIVTALLAAFLYGCGSKPSMVGDQTAMDKGERLMKDVDYKGALKEFRKVFKHENKSPQLYRLIAECFENLGEPDSAITYYEGAIVFRPTDTDSYQKIGDIYFKRTMYHEAMTWYDRARDLGYLKPESYNRLGDIYYRWRDYYQAREFYGLATTLDTTNADGFYGLGLTALAVQETTLALAYLNKACDWNHAGAAFMLGQLYFAMSDVAEAEKYFDKLLINRPTGDLAIKAREYKMRIDLLKKAGKEGGR